MEVHAQNQRKTVPRKSNKTNYVSLQKKQSTRGINTKYDIQRTIHLSAIVIVPKEYYIFVPYQTSQMSKN